MAPGGGAARFNGGLRRAEVPRMEEKLAPRVTVAVHAPPRAFAPGVQHALLRLGYNLVTPDAADALAREPGPLRPALRIVDDRQLDRAPLETGAGALPLVLLVGRGRLSASDARAVGSVRRRARLEPLFEVFQRTLEATPRSVPRAPTSLPVRALRGERAWAGAIRSLSWWKGPGGSNGICAWSCAFRFREEVSSTCPRRRRSCVGTPGSCSSSATPPGGPVRPSPAS